MSDSYFNAYAPGPRPLMPPNPRLQVLYNTFDHFVKFLGGLWVDVLS